MRTLIIEDEKAAVSNLKALLTDVAPQCNIVGITDSIKDSINWLQANPMPELVFMDVHLADGSAFEIFEHIRINCPIIFTTAYDEYSLRAFKVNSIDYLLKPIGDKEIRRALDKLYMLKESYSTESHSFSELMKSMSRQKEYKNYLLIPNKGSKLTPLPVESISYFHIDNGIVKAITKKNDSFIIPNTLEELTESLDPKYFFRANRQYIIAKDSVLDMDYWFNGRLAINLIVTTKEKIIVTKSRVSEFKEWFG